MANRKVLINRHTSGNTAPTASEMYLGEIAIAHETGKETIFTKNNAGDMVPFVSCAQTIAIIDSKIQTADADVKAATGETHLEVATGTGVGNENKFTLSTKDIQSEAEFVAYSAATNEALATLTSVLTALTDVVVTGITGDTIITATLDQQSTGSNVYTLTHKTGEQASGFKKLSTDAYGHVTASTDVLTADIQALGFNTSAETGEDLAELSGAVKANETHISELSAGTQHDIEALSANTHNKIVEVYGSANSYADAAIAEAILDLDSAISASTAGKFITAIAIENGLLNKIEEADIPVLEVESAGTGNVVAAITVEGHKITYSTASVATSEGIAQLSAATQAISGYAASEIAQLSGATQAISGYAQAEIAQLSGATEAISGYAHDEIAALSAGTIQLSADTYAAINQLSGYAHGEIAELSGAVQANETDIDNLSAATLNLSAVTLTGVSLNNTPLAVNNHIVSVPVATEGTEIEGATENSDSGTVASIKAVKEYVEGVVSSSVNYKGATGSTPTAATQGDLYIASQDFVVEGSKSAETGDFIIYNGSNWDVIEKNLDGAITGNLTGDTVTLGDSTNSVKSLANGAQGTVLTIGTAGTPVWADDPVLSVVSAGTGNVVSEITVNDHEITYQLGVKAATDADLQTLSGMVETISGYTKENFTALSAGTIQLSADTKAAIAELSAGTIQLSADTKAAIEDLSANTEAAIAAAINALDSTGATTAAGHYMTSVTITDGIITAVGEEALPSAVPVTTVNGATGDTATAVLNGIYTGGTDGHQLTLSATNKIFSATTADEAVKVKSALTINVLDSAGTTASTVTFDGSSTQSIDIPGSHDTATTQEGHYAPATAASAFTAPAGSFLSGVSVDDKNHVLAVAYANKVDSASSAEMADEAAKVTNALTVSGYSSETAATMDSAIAYDGSTAKSLTFGTVGDAGLNSMSMTTGGTIDVEVIDCGEY